MLKLFQVCCASLLAPFGKPSASFDGLRVLTCLGDHLPYSFVGFYTFSFAYSATPDANPNLHLITQQYYIHSHSSNYYCTIKNLHGVYFCCYFLCYFGFGICSAWLLKMPALGRMNNFVVISNYFG